MSFSEKHILRYLFAQKILTQEHVNSYLQMNPKPPLQSWLFHNKLLNQANWNQVIQILKEKEANLPPKIDQQSMPNSFVIPASETNKTLLLEQNSFVSPSDMTLQQETTNKKFQQYEILEQIGSGGMGIVYKARDILSKRIVALKILRKITDHDIKRFQIEGQATAQLNHPNIIEIYELGQTPMPYMAMEFVDGITLKDIITGERLKHRDIADIFKQIAEGLAYAHSKGIVHRDIKPANIIINNKKQAKIMDFGLAKDTNIDTSLSRTGDIVGTPQYLPPEQARGLKIDLRADIYALGATLYHILTEKPPFSGDSYMSLFYDIIHVNPTPVRKINKTIPADLESICMKCLEKSPDFRYQKAQDLAQDLQNFIERKPISAHKGKLYRWNKKFIAHVAKYKIIWSLVCINIAVFFIYFEPQQLVVMEKMPTLFHFTANFPEYDSNLPYLLEYYLIQLKELRDGKKNPKWRDIHAQLAKFYYALRKTNPDYVKNCLDSYHESGIRSLSEAEKLIQILIYEQQFKEAEERINNFLLKESFDGKFELLKPYKEICQYQQKSNVEITKLKQHSYGLWLLATQENDSLEKEKNLRQALKQSSKEENFYLDLMEIYKKENCYDAIEIVYPALQKINSHLIHDDFFLEEKQNDEFYMLYFSIHQLESLNICDEENWNFVYNALNSIAVDNSYSNWKRFIAHNYILKLLACRVASGKTTEYLTQKMHQHFALANQFIENHYLLFVYVGNFYYSQEKWVDALAYWDQAKYYFKPCSDWLLVCEKIVMTKIIEEERRATEVNK